MTTKFTASNGFKVEIDEAGRMRVSGDNVYGEVGPEGTEALREYFQHERDQELGRWRDPDNHDFVVYRMPEMDDDDGRAVAVLDDSTGVAFTYWEESGLGGLGVTRYEKGQEAAARYFAAHPETKPWDEAEPGEIWELVGADGLKQAWVRDRTGGWIPINAPKVMYYDGKGVTAGRRICLEED